MRIKPSALTLLANLAFAAAPVSAAIVDLIKIGTWTGTPDGSVTQDAELQTGGKYVIHTTYDTTTVNSTATQIWNTPLNTVSMNVYEANLQTPGNSFRLLVPMEGFDGGSPFIYDQDQNDHFAYPAAPNPTIQFTAPGGNPANFLGYRFSGNFEPGTNNHFIDIYSVTPDGVTANQVTDAVRCDDPGCSTGLPLVINSVNSLVDAVDLSVDAGNNKTYSAGTTSVTTDGSAGANNNLGAGRSDGEDFLSFAWSEGGSPLTGSMTPDGVNIAVGIANSGLSNTTDTATWQVQMDEDLTGLSATDTMTVSYSNAGPTALPGSNLTYDAGTTSVTANGGVSDPDLAINSQIAGFESHTFSWAQGGTGLPGGNAASVAVAIQNSGLTNTTDSVSFDLTVTDLAGASDTQSITVSYNNADPVLNDFSATASGDDINFTLSITDADLGINPFIADFEMLTVEIFESGALLSILDPLINTGSQLMDHASLLANFGSGTTVLEVRFYDLARDSADYLNAFLEFTVDALNPQPNQVPSPAPIVLILAGLLGLHLKRKRATV